MIRRLVGFVIFVAFTLPAVFLVGIWLGYLADHASRR